MPNTTPQEPLVPEESYAVGDLVYLTPSGHDWLTRSTKFPGINLSGRLGRIIDVYDWTTEKGKGILEGRQATGKWNSLKSEDFRFVVLVFYPDIEREGRLGIMHPELLPLFHPRSAVPGTAPLFRKLQHHLFDYITGTKELELAKHAAD